MTPQERKLVDDLFDRLARLENSPRDPDAENAIADGWERAPNAAYALVQTVIVQEEALKRANERIQELESQLGDSAGSPSTGGSFLESARAAMQGGGRGSVPSVRAAAPAASEPAPSKWNTGQAESRWNASQGQTQWSSPSGGAYPQQPGAGYPQQPGGYSQPNPPQSGGGSFLGTAASTAAGVIGGSLLMGGIRSLFGHQGGAHASAFDPGLSGDRGSPWGGSAANSDLARDAGLNDIGRAGAGGDQTAFYSGDDGGDDFADNGDFDAGDFGGDTTDT